MVFPGGGVDDRDRNADIAWYGPEPAWWAERLGVDVDLAEALVCAAARETFEESGVLFAGAGRRSRRASSTTRRSTATQRAALANNSLSFADFLRAEKLVLRADLLRPWANWVTPKEERTRRYDTYFFVGALPDGPARRRRQHRDRPGRLDHPAGRARRVRARAGRFLLPPTWTQLDSLNGRTVAEVLAVERKIVADRAAPGRDKATATGRSSSSTATATTRRATAGRGHGTDPMSVSEFVSVHVSDEQPGIGTLLLSRPPTNALTRQMYREIAAAAAELGERDDVAAVIVFGGHEIFSRRRRRAGAAHPRRRRGRRGRAGVPRRRRRASPRSRSRRSPPITGYALGSGLTLALAADWRISGDNVKCRRDRDPRRAGARRRRRGAAGPRDRREQGQGPGVQRALRRRQGGARAGPGRRDGGPRPRVRRRAWRGRSGSSTHPPQALAAAKARASTPLGCPAMRLTESGTRVRCRRRAGSANPHATAEEVEAARHDTKLAQVLYHDWEAETYDDKWSISYDQRCIDYARGRFDAIVPDEVQRELPYDRALELGCGTGFFLLNLIQSGVARRGSVTDLSPGMVKVATRNGQSLGLDIDGRVADAEGIPYEDDTFDLVVGHAVLHHIPDVELSLREVVRVLKPGGRFVFAGEPTTVGNVYARNAVDLTWNVDHPCHEAAGAERLAPPAGGARRVLARRGAGVDRRPAHLRAGRPGADGRQRRRRRGRAPPARSSPRRCWAGRSAPSRRRCRRASSAGAGRKFAFDSWTTLSWVDANVWRHVVPKGWFYNVMITGVKPSVEFRFTSTTSRTSAATRARRRCAEVDGYRADRRHPDLRHRFGANAFRRPRAVPSSRRRCCGARRRPSSPTPSRLVVHRRGAAAGDRRNAVAAAPRPAAGGRDRARRDLFGRHRTCRTAGLGRLRGRQRPRPGAAGDGAAQRRPDVALCRADALRPVTRDTVVVADPARRSGGRRRSTRATTPRPLDALLDVYARPRSRREVRSGNRFRRSCARLGFDGEIEVTSLARRCPRGVPVVAGAGRAGGDAAGPPCSTAASRSPTPNPTTAPSRRPGRWIVDPDGAVVRAGLVRHYAARHGLWQLDPDIAYLSGDELPDRRARLRGARRARLQRTHAAPSAFGARRRARSRSWSAASTSTPTRCGRGCGCAARSGCRW